MLSLLWTMKWQTNKSFRIQIIFISFLSTKLMTIRMMQANVIENFIFVWFELYRRNSKSKWTNFVSIASVFIRFSYNGRCFSKQLHLRKQSIELAVNNYYDLLFSREQIDDFDERILIFYPKYSVALWVRVISTFIHT